jgi:hypothetical protein
MKSLLVAASVAAALMVAACDRPPQPRTEPSAGPGGSSSSPVEQPRPQTNTQEKQPVQGQVDPKEPAQQKDFKQK